MRIISGKYKSRKLFTPADDNIRPTSDRAKETLFNILENRFSFRDAVCLDAFCGTGNLGLECISRGAMQCCFVDTDIRLVKKNVEMLNASDKCRVIRSEALNFLIESSDIVFDYIFCDPPYSYNMYDELTAAVFSMKTIFILEHSGKTPLNKKYTDYLLIHKKIGTVNFSIYDFRILK
ncbi:MAG: Ribosomal RNA small subunit methyltransferase D [Ignavibacteria bacterium]|nr:Ribosomal RNA small subunit methyltransferase D [Ignavibacteria bacterium]